jgi:hypothetical protein
MLVLLQDRLLNIPDIPVGLRHHARDRILPCDKQYSSLETNPNKAHHIVELFGTGMRTKKNIPERLWKKVLANMPIPCVDIIITRPCLLSSERSPMVLVLVDTLHD